MEENNRKGPGVFYAVVGVATLVVAIIGATFAYFSASVTPADGSDAITGETQVVSGASLSLSVEKINYNLTNDADYDDLVPAYFGSTDGTLNVANPGALEVDEVKTMIQNKCAIEGFTGCHVYKITASADQDITYANLLLNMSVGNHSDTTNTSNVGDKTQWGYVVFTASVPTSGHNAGTGTQDSVETGVNTHIALTSTNGAPAAIGEGFTNRDIHDRKNLVANEAVVYYLLVYVNDTNLVQNDAGTSARYVVGSYSGTVELQALGGKVRAAFGADSTTPVEPGNGD